MVSNQGFKLDEAVIDVPQRTGHEGEVEMIKPRTKKQGT
jgi:ribosomal protein S28E/S33